MRPAVGAYIAVRQAGRYRTSIADRGERLFSSTDELALGYCMLGIFRWAPVAKKLFWCGSDPDSQTQFLFLVLFWLVSILCVEWDSTTPSHQALRAGAADSIICLPCPAPYSRGATY